MLFLCSENSARSFPLNLVRSPAGKRNGEGGNIPEGASKLLWGLAAGLFLCFFLLPEANKVIMFSICAILNLEKW